MIHAKQYGNSKPALVVLHGLFGNADNWHSIAKKWQEDFTVYCLDLPNHGKSSRLTPVTYENMSNEIKHFLDQEGLQEVYLLGHSMGGKVAMQLASDFPEKIKKLVVADIAPVDYQPSHTEIFKGLLAINSQQPSSRKEADSILSEYESEAGVRQFLLKNLSQTSSGYTIDLGLEELHESYETILQSPSLKEGLETDILFIKGENSPYIQAKYQNQTARYFPNAQVKIIPGTGHWLHAEKPIPFTSLVKRFFTA
ncbi:alpha/beta hydrolase [Marinomonas piezotolerans]|uniref:Alpha/beta hydrolase n=1 Tax=Marinomonas piezotolerans TaxID=2213058 RepID=A0A370U866_9GAMM|nr:alpha/beta fold hydrolase [Marinomonas piezotolerans]RDL43952.1 alpha/beta hydrolase [Marinomonas piezotolerans]